MWRCPVRERFDPVRTWVWGYETHDGSTSSECTVHDTKHAVLRGRRMFRGRRFSPVGTYNAVSGCDAESIHHVAGSRLASQPLACIRRVDTLQVSAPAVGLGSWSPSTLLSGCGLRDSSRTFELESVRCALARSFHASQPTGFAGGRGNLRIPRLQFRHTAGALRQDLACVCCPVGPWIPHAFRVVLPSYKRVCAHNRGTRGVGFLFLATGGFPSIGWCGVIGSLQTTFPRARSGHLLGPGRWNGCLTRCHRRFPVFGISLSPQRPRHGRHSPDGTSASRHGDL